MDERKTLVIAVFIKIANGMKLTVEDVDLLISLFKTQPLQIVGTTDAEVQAAADRFRNLFNG